MTKDGTAKKSAKQLLRKYNLAVPSLDDLIYIVQDYGFEIIEYSLSCSSQSVDILIEELHLQSYANSRKSFTYVKADLRLLFLFDELSNDEKVYAISHELGHIVLGHLERGSRKDSNMVEERAANEFSHYLLQSTGCKSFRKWLCSHKAISIILGVAFLMLVIGIPTVSIVKRQASYWGEYYITVSGEKYHEKNCIFVKGKRNVHRMTIEEFETGKYAPCHICLPDFKG